MMRVTRHPLAVFAALLLPLCSQAAEPAATVQVAACGLEFELPAAYQVTRPQRQTDEHHGRACAFDIVKLRPEPAPRGECKDKEEGVPSPISPPTLAPACGWMREARHSQ